MIFCHLFFTFPVSVSSESGYTKKQTTDSLLSAAVSVCLSFMVFRVFRSGNRFKRTDLFERQFNRKD